eukprot:574319-Rhodomonas_salina.3
MACAGQTDMRYGGRRVRSNQSTANLTSTTLTSPCTRSAISYRISYTLGRYLLCYLLRARPPSAIWYELGRYLLRAGPVLSQCMMRPAVPRRAAYQILRRSMQLPRNGVYPPTRRGGTERTVLTGTGAKSTAGGYIGTEIGYAPTRAVPGEQGRGLASREPGTSYSPQDCKYKGLVTFSNRGGVPTILRVRAQIEDETMVDEEDITGDLPLMMVVKGDKLNSFSAKMVTMLVEDPDELADPLTKLAQKVYRPKGDEMQQRMALRIMISLAFIEPAKVLSYITLDESQNGAHSISFMKEVVDELGFDAENPLHHVLRAGTVVPAVLVCPSSLIRRAGTVLPCSSTVLPCSGTLLPGNQPPFLAIGTGCAVLA